VNASERRDPQHEFAREGVRSDAGNSGAAIGQAVEAPATTLCCRSSSSNGFVSVFSASPSVVRIGTVVKAVSVLHSTPIFRFGSIRLSPGARLNVVRGSDCSIFLTSVRAGTIAPEARASFVCVPVNDARRAVAQAGHGRPAAIRPLATGSSHRDGGVPNGGCQILQSRKSRETWAGRGLKPRWLAAAIKSGKKFLHCVLALRTLGLAWLQRGYCLRSC
jgi:H-NS histone family